MTFLTHKCVHILIFLNRRHAAQSKTVDRSLLPPRPDIVYNDILSTRTFVLPSTVSVPTKSPVYLRDNQTERTLRSRSKYANDTTTVHLRLARWSCLHQESPNHIPVGLRPSTQPTRRSTPAKSNVEDYQTSVSTAVWRKRWLTLTTRRTTLTNPPLQHYFLALAPKPLLPPLPILHKVSGSHTHRDLVQGGGKKAAGEVEVHFVRAASEYLLGPA